MAPAAGALAELGHLALVDAVGVDDDQALRGLAEDLVRRTTGTAPEAITSRSTVPGPTEGS